MEDVETVRRRRLQQLIAQIKRDTGAGATEVARRTGIRQSHISRMASENIRKPMGPAIARRIEAGCGLPRGWLDTMDEAAAVLDLMRRIVELVPPDAWNPLTAKLLVRMADIALKEGWDEPTLGAKVREYLRLTGDA